MTGRTSRAPLAVCLEEGRRRTFAIAVDWPGWARSGRTREAALEALAEYAPRYSTVIVAAGLQPPDPTPEFDVVERVPGNATTDFGAPGVVADVDRQALDPGEADRHARLVAASWARLDEIATGAPAALRKGPRGGGRDRDAIVEHVLSSEQAYRRKAGIPGPAARSPTDPATALELRGRFLEMLRSPAAGTVEPAAAWPPRYAARRFAWHALDHAWEIEDRSAP